MQLSPNKRLEVVCQKLSLSKRQLAVNLGVSPQTIGNTISGKQNLSYLVVEAIAAKYPQINERWLLTGEGEVFKDDTTDFLAEIKELKKDNTYLKEKNELLQKLVDKDAQTIKDLRRDRRVSDEKGDMALGAMKAQVEMLELKIQRQDNELAALRQEIAILKKK